MFDMPALKDSNVSMGTGTFVLLLILAQALQKNAGTGDGKGGFSLPLTQNVADLLAGRGK